MESIQKEIDRIIEENFSSVDPGSKFSYVSPGYIVVFTGVKTVDDIKIRSEFDSVKSFKNLLPAVPLDLTFGELIVNLIDSIIVEFETGEHLKVTITDEGFLEFKRVSLIAATWVEC